ncbi:hypothetical protein EGW08_012997 [Elysia chlorotica]|uniref:Uncharacterized protein n=1 Tax=Elysia chlorotica TaxID=188477 RepID=A0A3S1BB12_ELYCH|nr:hypothetical protein EGW08_012997 [Elysia chlorotica]
MCEVKFLAGVPHGLVRRGEAPGSDVSTGRAQQGQECQESCRPPVEPGEHHGAGSPWGPHRGQPTARGFDSWLGHGRGTDGETEVASRVDCGGRRVCGKPGTVRRSGGDWECLPPPPPVSQSQSVGQAASSPRSWGVGGLSMNWPGDSSLAGGKHDSPSGVVSYQDHFTLHSYSRQGRARVGSFLSRLGDIYDNDCARGSANQRESQPRVPGRAAGTAQPTALSLTSSGTAQPTALSLTSSGTAQPTALSLTSSGTAQPTALSLTSSGTAQPTALSLTSSQPVPLAKNPSASYVPRQDSEDSEDSEDRSSLNPPVYTECGRGLKCPLIEIHCSDGWSRLVAASGETAQARFTTGASSCWLVPELKSDKFVCCRVPDAA